MRFVHGRLGRIDELLPYLDRMTSEIDKIDTLVLSPGAGKRPVNLERKNGSIFLFLLFRGDEDTELENASAYLRDRGLESIWHTASNEDDLEGLLGPEEIFYEIGWDVGRNPAALFVLVRAVLLDLIGVGIRDEIQIDFMLPVDPRVT